MRSKFATQSVNHVATRVSRKEGTDNGNWPTQSSAVSADLMRDFVHRMLAAQDKRRKHQKHVFWSLWHNFGFWLCWSGNMGTISSLQCWHPFCSHLDGEDVTKETIYFLSGETVKVSNMARKVSPWTCFERLPRSLHHELLWDLFVSPLLLKQSK